MTDWKKLATEIHADNVKAGWWTDPKTGADLHETRDRLNLNMLIITELSEARDAYLVDANDDKLPQYKGVGVELADAQIRILDRLGADGFFEEGKFVPAYASSNFGENIRQSGFDYFFSDMTHIICLATEHDRKGRRYEAGRFLLYVLNTIELAGHQLGFDMNELREAKREFNRHRADHKLENRVKDGGKVY